MSDVVPVYKSKNTFKDLYPKLVKTLETINPNFETIFLEDCGGDGSWNIIEKLAMNDPRVLGQL